MNARVPLAIAGCCVIGLGACTTALPPDQTEALGGPFNEQLKQGYVTLAGGSVFNADYFHFHGKARAAMLGDTVWPDKVASRTMPADYRPELIAWRERLLDALDAGARDQAPLEAADAQVAFDCWLEEVGSGTPINQDTACKTRFLTALGKVEAALRNVPDAYVVYFDLGSDRLSGDARDQLYEAARAVKLVRPARVNVVGYADPTGSASANQALSQQRAQAVADALIRAGVPEDALVVSARGAIRDRTATPEDRRVEVTFGG